jgi:hypothetical protein
LNASTWVVVVGQPSVHAVQLSPGVHAIAQWLRRVLLEPLGDPDTRNRLVTVCSGSLIAARAGWSMAASAPPTTICSPRCTRSRRARR